MSKRTILLAAVVALVALVIAGAVSYPLYRGLTAADGPGAVTDSNYSSVRSLVADGKVSRLTFYAQGTAVAKTAAGPAISTLVPPMLVARLADEAASKGAEVAFEPDTSF